VITKSETAILQVLETARLVLGDLQPDLLHRRHRQRIEFARLDPRRFDIDAAPVR